MSLTEEQLAEIRARFQALEDHATRLDLLEDEKKTTEALQTVSWPCAWDVEPLLAEIERLQLIAANVTVGRLTCDISRDLRDLANSGGMRTHLLVEAADQLDELITSLARAERARDEAEVNAFAKLEADIRRRTSRMAAEQDVIWRATKLVQRMKGAVGDSPVAAQQWLDDESYQLFAAVLVLEVSIEGANDAVARPMLERRAEVSTKPASDLEGDADPRPKSMLERIDFALDDEDMIDADLADIQRRVAAEKAVLEAAKECVGDLRNAGYRVSDNARALIAAVDGLAGIDRSFVNEGGE